MDKYIEDQIITFNELYKEYDNIYQRLTDFIEMSRVRSGVLYTLDEFRVADKKICTQKDITDSLLYSKQSVNGAIRDLKNEGYITLEDIKGNKKSKNICLTDKGVQLIQEKITKIVEAENKAFSRLDTKEREDLINLFSKVSELLREEFEKLLD